MTDQPQRAHRVPRTLRVGVAVIAPVLAMAGAIAFIPALSGADGPEPGPSVSSIGGALAISAVTAEGSGVLQLAAPHVEILPVVTPAAPVPHKSFCQGARASYVPGDGYSSWLAVINQERALNGAAALTWSSALATKAQGWSQTLADRDQATPEVLGDALAHSPHPGYENVAMNYNSYDLSERSGVWTAHTALMASEHHCYNLMNPALKRIGMGKAQSADGVWYFTQNFSK